MSNKIFVYGSLMEDFFNYNKYLKGKVLKRSHARAKGKLFHQINKGYPAMVDGDDFVYGELLEIDDWDNTIIELDRLENFYGEDNPNNEYNRVLLQVEQLGNSSIISAFVYRYNCKDEQALEKERYIPYGNWRIFMKG